MNKKKGPAAHESLIDRCKKYPYLCLRSKMERKECILKNSCYPPYKKPRLPFGGMSSKVHQLLRSLKTAHVWMASEHIRLVENLPAGYSLDRVLYSIDLSYDYWMAASEIGKAFFEDQSWRPFLAKGLVVSNENSEDLHCSFDLTPFYDGYEYPEYPGYSKINESIVPVEAMKTAAGFYNECVDSLFEQGFLVFPLFYVDGLAGFYPPETIEGAPIVEI